MIVNTLFLHIVCTLYSFQWRFHSNIRPAIGFSTMKNCVRFAQTNSCSLLVILFFFGLFCCVVQYLVSRWNCVPPSKSYRLHLDVKIRGHCCFCSRCGEFRCHALVKHSPDAFSFDYTRFVLFGYASMISTLCLETHSDVFVFSVCLSTLNLRISEFQCKRFLWYLITWSNTIKINATNENCWTFFQLIYRIFMLIKVVSNAVWIL